MTFDAQYDQICRAARSRVLATLVRLLGSIDDAEDATQEALTAALSQWRRDGIPANPGPWLVSVGHHKHLDRRRRDAVRARSAEQAGAVSTWVSTHETMGPEQLLLAAELSENAVIDDRLRLIFICCHPALNNEAQVALTLRTLGGLSTSAIARAFLVSEATMAQRLVRAKAKIRDACIPYTVPSRKDLHERLRSVLQVIYLIFNEGYGEDIREGVRQSMTIEAIRLGRLLLELLPGECEVHGLLALMLLHQARASARFDTSGDLILLQQQDRTLWDAALITEGIAVTKESLRSGLNAYGIQAAIAAVHAEACQASDTDWAQIEALYGVLGNIEPSPIVELNRAVAIAMQDKTSEAASLVASLDGLDDYSPYWATKAYLLARTARTREASLAYRRAADLAPPGAQKRYLERRSAELHNPAG